MIDYFAVLGLERRPAIDENALKEIYFRKSAARDADASSLNEAFHTLLRPVSRIQHLLKLEFGEVRAKQIGSDLEECFAKVAKVLHQADEAIGSFAGQQSPLLRAIAYRRVQPIVSELLQVQTELARRENELVAEIEQLDQRWPERKQDSRDALAQAAFRLAFVQKWSDQVKDRVRKLEE
jgi:DnaJ-domain-containing protein 1